MALVQLSTLRARAQARADMDNVTGFIATATWNQWINDSCTALYDMLVNAYEDYFTSPTPYAFSSVAGTEVYALPSGFYKSDGLDIQDASSGLWFDCKRYKHQERNRFRNATAVGGAVYRPHYRVMAGSLSILPVPVDVRSFRLYFTPTMTALSADTDTFDGVNGWESWVVVDVARKALQKEEADTSPLERELAELKARIDALAANRDQAHPATVTDVSADEWGLW